MFSYYFFKTVIVIDAIALSVHINYFYLACSIVSVDVFPKFFDTSYQERIVPRDIAALPIPQFSFRTMFF